MSADSLKFEQGFFDLIVCKDTFHHFQNPVKVLKEMYGVLKKGGHIYITDIRRDAPEDIFYQGLQELVENNIIHATQFFHSIKASYTMPEIKQILKKAKLKNYKIWKNKITKNFFKEYCVSPKNQLWVSNYFSDRWMLIIKK
jgi:ubiquinone/menaquinone biosynthesis C-methylase UbiE